MSVLEVTGKLIKKFDTQQINDTFRKREFVIEITETAPSGMTFTNYASFQLMQNNVAAIDRFNEGEDIKVSFNIRGNKWEKDGETRYITNLNAWRVEPLMAYHQQGQPQMPPQGYPQQGYNQGGFPPQAPPMGYPQQAPPQQGMPAYTPPPANVPPPPPPPAGDDDLPF